MLAALRNNNTNNTRRLKRNHGSRHLIAPNEKHIRMSLTPTNVYGANRNNQILNNNNRQLSRNLDIARASIAATPPRFKGIGLSPKLSKLYANFSNAHNSPDEMLRTLDLFRQRIFSTYYG